ncbi:MAG: hypothetical protein ACPGXK_16105 [Phycisphaerae bacterium]
MNGFGNNSNATDAFAQFWTDVASRMSGAGMSAFQQQSQEAMAKAMRQAFFDAWAKQSEEFLSSDAFLDSMKQSMDSALMFREQVNQFVNRAAADSPFSTREDTETMTQVLRSFEERVVDRLERLSERMDELESKVAGGGKAAASKAGTAKKGGGR